VLIALCSDNVLPDDCQFGVVDMMRVMSRVDAKFVVRPDPTSSAGRSVDGDLDCLLARTACELGSDGVSAAMESLSTSETVTAASPMDIDIAGSSASSDKHSHLIPVDIHYSEIMIFLGHLQDTLKLMLIFSAFSALTLLVGRQEGHPAWFTSSPW